MPRNQIPLRASLAYILAARLAVAIPRCTSDTFASIAIPRGNVLSINATISNVTVPDLTPNVWGGELAGATASPCEVTVQYAHPGWNDTITTFVWLPVSGWNGRLMGIGGGAWAAGITTHAALPVVKGYAAVTTDGGHGPVDDQSSISWATIEGNLNWYAFQDYAAVALDDSATLGKAAALAYYGREPDYSYWNGCSNGGREGHMMAQRYPTQYDGILATSPALKWDKLIMAMFWPQFIMNQLGYYPPPCELDAITEAAIGACDALDGVQDGVIANLDRCNFDPKTVVGQEVKCTDPNGTVAVSEQAAQIASAAWFGPQGPQGKSLWPGIGYDANFSGIAHTVCTTIENCTSSPFGLASDWLSIFLLQNTSADLAELTYAEYYRLFRLSTNVYASVVGTGDPDLTDFKQAGGKMITWHGTADQVIPYEGSVKYYQRVLDLDPTAADYFRLFLAPGIGHCGLGPGWFPGTAVDALVDWVERGVAPATLFGGDYAGGGVDNTTRSVNLCAYPQSLVYVSGDPNLASSFECKE